MKLSAKLPHDDEGAKLMRFEDVRGQRYTEIFLIGGHAITHDLVGGVYNTIGINDPAGTGDTSPQDVLDKVNIDDLKAKYDVLSAFKNGPRLWCLDWAEVMVGGERDFSGLKARWVMWLDVPKEMRKHESVAYKPISGKRDTRRAGTSGRWSSNRTCSSHRMKEPSRSPKTTWETPTTGSEARTATTSREVRLDQRPATGPDAPPICSNSAHKAPGAEGRQLLLRQAREEG